MKNKSGQSYKVRNLLYSLWNGAPVGNLIETRALDYELKLAFCVVVLCMGSAGFDYDQVSGPIKKAGLFEWFIEEAATAVKVAEEWVESAREEVQL